MIHLNYFFRLYMYTIDLYVFYQVCVSYYFLANYNIETVLFEFDASFFCLKGKAKGETANWGSWPMFVSSVVDRFGWLIYEKVLISLKVTTDDQTLSFSGHT